LTVAVLAIAGAMIGCRAQAAAISPEGLGIAADQVLLSTRLRSFIGADVTAGTGPGGAVRVGTGAAMNGAVASAGVVLSDGAGGAHLIVLIAQV
jgi:hypothetical protein